MEITDSAGNVVEMQAIVIADHSAAAYLAAASQYGELTLTKSSVEFKDLTTQDCIYFEPTCTP